MIRHIVLVRFAATTSDADKIAVLAELAGLQAHLPGMRAFAAGPNRSPEGLARGFTHAFTIDFASEADRDAYLVHPAHQAAGARLVNLLEGGRDGLAVVDIAFEAQTA
jgi:hypothetical protein